MISGRDVDSFTDLFFIVRNPWVILAIGILTLALIYFAIRDSEECSHQTCEHGTPQIVNHECLCTEKPGK